MKFKNDQTHYATYDVRFGKAIGIGILLEENSTGYKNL